MIVVVGEMFEEVDYVDEGCGFGNWGGETDVRADGEGGWEGTPGQVLDFYGDIIIRHWEEWR